MKRSLSLVMILPVVAGCHLFSSGTIATTCEDLEGGCDPDSGPEDTGSFVPDSPYGSWFVSGSGTANEIQVRVVDPDLDVVVEASTDPSREPGPVAWDEVEERAFYYDNATRFLHVLCRGADRVIQGEAPDSGATSLVIVDLHVIEGTLYALAPTALYQADLEAEAFVTVVGAGGFQDARSVFPAPGEHAYVLDAGGPEGLPDLWRVDLGAHSASLMFQNFDDGQGRAHAGFLGEEDMPWVCSSLGATWAVADLSGGSRVPSVVPDAADMEALVGRSFVEDVTDCGWDAASSRFLVASSSAGLLGIDAWNHVDRILAPQEDEDPFRASFAPALQAR